MLQYSYDSIIIVTNVTTTLEFLSARFLHPDATILSFLE